VDLNRSTEIWIGECGRVLELWHFTLPQRNCNNCPITFIHIPSHFPKGLVLKIKKGCTQHGIFTLVKVLVS
jgi:hypothetical protein